MPMSLDEDDGISLELNGYFEPEERIYDDFNIFGNGNEMVDNEIGDYFSCEGESRMEEEFDNYIG